MLAVSDRNLAGTASGLVDWILKNRALWRSALREWLPNVSTSVVPLGVSGSRPPGSPVERVAIARAAVSLVLDAVDRAIAGLPEPTRRAVACRYDNDLTLSDTAHYSHLTMGRVRGVLTVTRQVVAAALSRLPSGSLPAFRNAEKYLRTADRHWLKPHEMHVVPTSTCEDAEDWNKAIWSGSGGRLGKERD